MVKHHIKILKSHNDDYKSFVNFLNLRSNEQAISGEKLQIILAGISEITADVETQRGLMNILVENRFKDIINGDKDDETILKGLNILLNQKQTNVSRN